MSDNTINRSQLTLDVTYEATEYLAYMLAEANAPNGTAIRLMVNTNGIKINLDRANVGDETFEHDGKMGLMMTRRFQSCSATKRSRWNRQKRGQP